MREILFRGKAMTTDRFVEGAYYHQMEFYGDECDEHYIISSKDVLEDNMTCCDEVFPESVSEFTGLTDKNGTKIFEGDIVKAYNICGEEEGIGVVHWSELFVAWNYANHKCMYGGDIASYEVIGNIHDNPELLGDK